jgi:hypothetical protein
MTFLRAAAAISAASAFSCRVFLSVSRSDLANWSAAVISSPEEDPFFDAPVSAALKVNP